MKFFLKYSFLFFLFIFFLLVFSYVNFDKVNRSFDEKLRDFFFEIRGTIPTTGQVTIIDIDEKSINTLGQWPFSRINMAQVLANLANSGAGIIGLDVIFSEYDRSSPAFMAKSLGVKGKYIDSDELLANVISKTPTVLGYYFSNDDSKNLQPHSQTNFDLNSSSNLIKFEKVVTNIPVISNAAYSSGFFNAFSNTNGKITEMPLILEYKNKIYPSLPLEMISIASGTKMIKILKDKYSIYGLKLRNLSIPINDNGFMQVNFRGPQKSFKYLSFLDVLNGDFNKQDVEGKFILIGTSIKTLADLRATTYDLAMPGVEIHANVIDNILKGDILYKPSYSKLIDIFVIFGLSVILGFILLRIKSFTAIFVAFTFISFIYIGFYYLLIWYGLILNLFYPIVSTTIITIIAIYLNYSKEKMQKEFISHKFEKKVSFEVMSDLLSHEGESFQARQEEITILFSDIRDFTSISEKLNSPKTLIDLLNSYFEPMTNIITNNKGTVDKFIGDAIMAYWNAPNKVQDHADIALKSALQQTQVLAELNKTLKKEFDVTIHIGIGIHTGNAVIGEMGSQGRSDYTIIGDNVNLSSRIEGLTKYFGVNILISRATKNLLKEKYNLRYIGGVVVKGKTTSIPLYEVMSDEEYEKFKAIEDDYKAAIDNFKNRNFKDSLSLFQKIENIHSDKINNLYIEKLTAIENRKSAELSMDFIMDSK